MFVASEAISAAAQQNYQQTAKFRRGRPEALGTVQIIIGTIVLLFGLTVFGNSMFSLPLFSGIFVWGALFFITSGSITVAAGKRLNRCLVRTALGFNVVAAVSSGVSIILYSIDAHIQFMHGGSHRYYSDCQYCYYQSGDQSGAVSCVLALFCALEFVVSIVVAAFACYDVCGSTNQPIIVINQMLQPDSETQQAPPTYGNVIPKEAPPLYKDATS